MKIAIADLLLLMPVLSAGAQEPTPVNAPPQVPPVATPQQTAEMAAESAAGDYSFDIHRLSAPPRIDGKLDEPVWQEANLLENFVQIEPESGKLAVEKTEVRVGYDSDNIYFGVRCYDSQPNRLVAGSRSADAYLAADDTISIILDTFHDRRNGFLFILNPIGAKTDGLIRNEAEEVNTDWDGLWDGVTTRDAQGWMAEVAIPFRTLRFSGGKDLQSWGFNIRRFVARTQESSLWKPIVRRPGNLTPYLISEYGEIRGLRNLGNSGGRYQFVPFGIGRSGRDFRADAQSDADAGGDLKINLTSQLVADLTVRTDFAEVEADQQQFNLERFKLFYPEQRQFFLEGANLFYFGDRPEPFAVPESFSFFFSRQIGLAEDGRVVVPVTAGAKLAGRVGDTSIGLLNMSTESTSYFNSRGTRIDEPETNFTVLRLKRQIFGSSTIGLIGLNKDPKGGEYNRGLGVDWDLNFGKQWFTAGYLTKTDTPGLEGDDSAYSGDLVYKGKSVRLRHRYTNIGDNFNPEIGFLTRSGIIKNHFNALSNITLEKNPFGIHRITLVSDNNHITDQKGNLETQLSTYELGFASTRGEGVAFLYYDDLENLDLPLAIAKKATIPAGKYRFRSLFTGISSGYTRKIGFTFWYHPGGYYDGDRLRTLLTLIIRPFPGLVIAPTYDRVKVDAPWGNFVTRIAQTAIDYSVSTTLSARLTLQRQPGDNYRANFIIDWMYRPGSNLYLVYNDIQDLDDIRRGTGFSILAPGRTFIVKATRRFDF
jgi:hypothetical protein